MKERAPTSKERLQSPSEIEKAGETQREALREKVEHEAKNHEKSAHEIVENIKQAAIEQADSSKSRIDTPLNKEQSPAERRGPLSKQQKDRSFDRHLKVAQADMSQTSRAFSKVIHTKAVEKTADIASSTVARPNALLFGSAFAFFSVTAIYLIAKGNGYPLSGFETIGTFAVGWAIGVIYDYLRIMLRGRRH